MRHELRNTESLERLERIAEKESLPSIGPIKGKIIAHVIQDYKPGKILELEHYMDILQY